MAITTIHPDESQTQEDELDLDEETPPPPPPAASRSKGKRKRANNDSHQRNNHISDDDIPVPQLPPPESDLDGRHPARVRDPFPSFDLTRATLQLPRMAHLDGNFSSGSSSLRHLAASQPSHSTSSSSSSSRHHRGSLGPSVEVYSNSHTTINSKNHISNISASRKHSRQYESQPVSNTGGLSILSSMVNPSRLPASQGHRPQERTALTDERSSRSSSPPSESDLSADNSRDLEEVQESLTRQSTTSNFKQRKKLQDTAHQRLTDIAEKESQNDREEDDSDSDDDNVADQRFPLEDETQKYLDRTAPTAGTSHSRNPLPSSHLSFGEGLEIRPPKNGRASYSSSSIATFSQSVSKLASPDRRSTARTITSSPKSKNANRSSQNKHRAGSQTAESDEDDDQDHGEENDRTCVNRDTSRRTSDSDATRFENSAQHYEDPSFDNEHPEDANTSGEKGANQQNILGNGNKYDTRGEEVFKIPQKRNVPMARRQGKSVRESRVSSQVETEIDDDEDESPPPLSKTLSTGLKHRQPPRNLAPTLQNIVTARKSARVSTTSVPDAAPRRSSRSSTDASVPKLKVGDFYPLQSYMKLLDSAKLFIEQGEHVANLTLTEMYLNEDNNFEETQKAEAKLEKDPEAAVRTWQMFIYCRNRKAGVKSLGSKKALSREPSSPHANRRVSGVNAGPSRSGTNAPSAASVASNGSAVPPSSNTSGYPPADTILPFPPLEMPPADIYRHAKDGNCPGQVSAYIEIDPHTYGRSFWKVDQVTDHCLECVTMDTEIGKGMSDRLEARKEYFDYWSDHWKEQVKAVLERTQNFRKPPPLPEKFAQALADRQDEVVEEGDDDEEPEIQQLPPPSPARRKSKRKAQAPRIFHLDDYEIDGRNSPELYGESPSPAKKARFAAADGANSSASINGRRGLSVAGPSHSQAAKGKGRAKKTIQSAPHHLDDEYDLRPHTLLVDLNLPASMDKLLDELSIYTLAELREAIKGDNGYFRNGTDIPVEEFLSFMQTKLHHYAKGVIGFQYDFNRKSGQAEQNGDDDDEVDPAEVREREKKDFVNDCVTILKTGRVLTRALRAVHW